MREGIKLESLFNFNRKRRAGVSARPPSAGRCASGRAGSARGYFHPVQRQSRCRSGPIQPQCPAHSSSCVNSPSSRRRNRMHTGEKVMLEAGPTASHAFAACGATKKRSPAKLLFFDSGLLISLLQGGMERKFLIWITKFFDQLTGNKTVFLIQCSRRNPLFIVGTEGGDGDYLRPV